MGRGAVVQEAVNDALPRFFAEAAEAENVRAIGQPEVDVTAVPLEDGQDLEFTVETDVRPEVELPDLEGIAVEVDTVEASEEDVEERLTALRERFGSLVGVDRAVEEGDFIVLDLSATIDGEEIDSVSGVSFEVGSKNMLDGMDEAVVGLSAQGGRYEENGVVENLAAQGNKRVRVSGDAGLDNDITRPLRWLAFGSE